MTQTNEKPELRPNYYRVLVRARDPKTGEFLPEPVEVECFDLIDALGLGFYEGNVLKYLMRAGRKDEDDATRDKDLLKVSTYGVQSYERR